MSRDLILRGGRILRSGSTSLEALVVRIGGNGRIVAIAPDLPDGDAQVCVLDGQLVLPGLVDIHQHLDKSRTRALVSNPSGTLAGASAAYRALAPTITPDQIIARALRTVEACSAFGTVAIRSHTNIDPQSGIRGIEAMVALRQRCADRMRIQIVAHVTSDATSMLPETEAWLRSAIDLGVDAIGGVPAFSDQPIAFLKLLFEMAQRSGLPLDLHIDEHLDETRLLFDELAQMTRAYGMAGRVVAGHCSALSAMPPDAALRTIDNLRDAGVGIVTLPAANLFLQGREADRLPPRGLTRVQAAPRCRCCGRGRLGQCAGSVCPHGLRRFAGDCAVDVARRPARSRRSAKNFRDGQCDTRADDGPWRGLGHSGGCTGGYSHRTRGLHRRSGGGRRPRAHRAVWRTRRCLDVAFGEPSSPIPSRAADDAGERQGR